MPWSVPRDPFSADPPAEFAEAQDAARDRRAVRRPGRRGRPAATAEAPPARGVARELIIVGVVAALDRVKDAHPQPALISRAAKPSCRAKSRPGVACDGTAGAPGVGESIGGGIGVE